MKIIVLNGSPKGRLSVTMEYIQYIQNNYKEHELQIINISQQINKIEKDKQYFNEILEKVKTADGVIWGTPVYHALVPSQYKRFIELIFESETDAFKGKHATALTTSIHYYDHTCHNYLHAICDDLDMKYVDFYSADMYDLFEKEERTRLMKYAKNFFDAISSDYRKSKTYFPIFSEEFNYKPGEIQEQIDTQGKKIKIIMDVDEPNSNLSNMVNQFMKCCKGNVEKLVMTDFSIKGGCIGCINCGLENICSYHGKDEFYDMVQKLLDSDIIVFAGKIVDRYLSSEWKRYHDRSFYRCHTPIYTGRQIGYIISGPLIQIPNVRQILRLYPDMEEANLVDVITDETGDSSQIDGLLHNLAKGLITCAVDGYVKPHTFLGVAGNKIFRDDIYSRLRIAFQSDYKYFKKHKKFDFPKLSWKYKLAIPASKMIGYKKIQKRIKHLMFSPFENLNKKLEAKKIKEEQKLKVPNA